MVYVQVVVPVASKLASVSPGLVIFTTTFSRPESPSAAVPLIVDPHAIKVIVGLVKSSLIFAEYLLSLLQFPAVSQIYGFTQQYDAELSVVISHVGDT